MKKPRSRFCALFLGILLLLLTATIGFGATRYVAVDGDNSGEGTQGDPWETIQHAVDQADDGDTIMVEAGTYSGGISISSDRLTLQSVSGAGATTISGGTNGIELTGNGLTVEGFTIESNDCGIDIPNPQSEDVTLSSNSIRDFTEEGIYFEDNIAGCSVTIQSNTVDGGTYGIDIIGDAGQNDQPVTLRIVDNTVTGSSSTGIYFDDLYTGSVEISGNSLTDCHYSGIYIDETGHDGIEISFKIHDNTIALSEGTSGTYGIYIYSPERTTWVTENTITGDYDYGIYADYVGYYGHDPALIYVEDNVVTGASSGIYLYDVFYFGGSLYIRDNTISGAEDYGVYLYYLGYDSDSEGFTFTFEDNLIFDCNYGLYLYELFSSATGTAVIRGSSLLDNNYGLYIDSINYFEGSTLTIEDNNFDGNDDYGLYNNASELIVAMDNWWGDDTGPYDGRLDPENPDYNNPLGQGDEVSAYVDYAGWRETPYTGGAGGGSSGGGCAAGGFSPAMLLLLLPLASLLGWK